MSNIPVKPISADSHIVEPIESYTTYMDPAFRDRAPKIVRDPEHGGDVYRVEGLNFPMELGGAVAAGFKPEEIRHKGVKFEEIHRGSWDPTVRLADQDRDGIAAEFLYPTYNMGLCNHPDADLKQAVFTGYNRWLADYVSFAPDRLFGMGMTAVRSVPEAIADFRKIKQLGFKGVMMPAFAATAEDYNDPVFDPLWATAVELDLPIAFHIFTGTDLFQKPRGPKVGMWLSVMRGVQDIITMFVMGGVFARHPKLKLVCVEGDAGWAPHFMYRLDHAYKRHGSVQQSTRLPELPSHYFRQNVYLTFQDDWSAFQVAHLVNSDRLLWANDFPHGDSTWPWSQELLEEQLQVIPVDTRARILRHNVEELFGLAA